MMARRVRGGGASYDEAVDYTLDLVHVFFILVFCFFFFFLPRALEGVVTGEEKGRGFLSRCRQRKVIPGSDGGWKWWLRCA